MCLPVWAVGQGQMAILPSYHAVYKVLPCLHGTLNVTQTLELQQS